MDGLVVRGTGVLDHRGEESAAGASLAGTLGGSGRIHSRHGDVAADREGLHAVLGLTDTAGPQRRPEADHVLPHADPEALGGHQVTDLVQSDRHGEAHEEQGEADDECDHEPTVLAPAYEEAAR